MNETNLTHSEISVKPVNELLYAGSCLCEAVEKLSGDFQEIKRLADLFTTVAKKVTGGDL